MLKRREFIKVGMGSAIFISTSKNIRANTLQEGLVWKDKMPINPEIDNMRVVCCYDEGMLSTIPNSTTQADMVKAVNGELVSKNLDKMAMTLTNKNSPEEAWKTIFRSSKPWKDTRVMIKVNCVEPKCLANVSVIKKITDILTGFGVPPSNIVLFDGQGKGWSNYQNFVSLTDNTKILAKLSNSYDSLGGKVKVTIPGISSQGNGPKELVEGITDIIVNIAVNKGHNSNFGVGRTTLCLKNHFGTFLQDNGMANHLHTNTGLINSNKIAAIVGGNPVRQQLCIIDSIIAMKNGLDSSYGGVDSKPNRLIMGTFAGAVDYCCVKKIREPLLKATHVASEVSTFLTSFGYKETDPQWVEIDPTGIKTEKVNPPENKKPFLFKVITTQNKELLTTFYLPPEVNNPSVKIFDIKGTLVTELKSQPHTTSLIWDGRTSSGGKIGKGTYIVTISDGRFRESEKLTVF